MSKILNWLLYILGLVLGLNVSNHGDYGGGSIILILSNILLQLNYIYYEVKIK